MLQQQAVPLLGYGSRGVESGGGSGSNTLFPGTFPLGNISCLSFASERVSGSKSEGFSGSNSEGGSGLNNEGGSGSDSDVQSFGSTQEKAIVTHHMEKVKEWRRVEQWAVEHRHALEQCVVNSATINPSSYTNCSSSPPYSSLQQAEQEARRGVEEEAKRQGAEVARILALEMQEEARHESRHEARWRSFLDGIPV
jgi:hypothetical protein